MYIKLLWFIITLQFFMQVLNLMTHCMNDTLQVGKLTTKFLDFFVEFFVFHLVKVY